MRVYPERHRLFGRRWIGRWPARGTAEALRQHVEESGICVRTHDWSRRDSDPTNGRTMADWITTMPIDNRSMSSPLVNAPFVASNALQLKSANGLSREVKRFLVPRSTTPPWPNPSEQLTRTVMTMVR